MSPRQDGQHEIREALETTSVHSYSLTSIGRIHPPNPHSPPPPPPPRRGPSPPAPRRGHSTLPPPPPRDEYGPPTPGPLPLSPPRRMDADLPTPLPQPPLPPPPAAPPAPRTRSPVNIDERSERFSPAPAPAPVPVRPRSPLETRQRRSEELRRSSDLHSRVSRNVDLIVVGCEEYLRAKLVTSMSGTIADAYYQSENAD